MPGRFSVEAIFRAVDRVTAPVNRMQNRVGKMTRRMKAGFGRLNRTLDKTHAKIKAGALATVVSIGLVGTALANVTDAGAQFGRAIGSAAAKFPDRVRRGTDAFRALEDSARAVGRTTEFTSVQAAQGLNFLAKAGYSAGFAMKALPAIVDFATASEIDFATAADIASDALGAFGMDSDDLGQKMKNLNRIMDVMSMTANSSNISVSQLFETVKKSAPIAVQAGQSVETFAAVAGTLAGVGIKAEIAGIATKNLALALSGVGNKAAKTFKALNIPLAEKGRMRDIADVFADLNDALKGKGQQQVLETMFSIFGKLPLAAAMNLLGKGSDKIRELRKVLEQAGGSSKRTARFIRNDVKGSLDGLKSAIESVKISIFSTNEGPLKDAIDNFTKLVRANEKLIAVKVGGFLHKVITNLDTIWRWAKRVGIAVGVFYTFMAAVKALNIVLATTNLIMAANPFILLGVAAIAVTAAIAGMIIFWDKFNKTLRVTIKTILTLLGPVGQLIRAAIKIREHWEPIKKFFEGLGSVVGKVTGFIGKAGIPGLPQTGPQQAPIESNAPQMVSPQARTARVIEETRSSTSAEVTIKDETGRSEVTKGQLGSNVRLQHTGAF